MQMKVLLTITVNPEQVLNSSDIGHTVAERWDNLRTDRPGSDDRSLLTMAVASTVTDEVKALLDSVGIDHSTASARIEEA